VVPTIAEVKKADIMGKKVIYLLHTMYNVGMQHLVRQHNSDQ